MNKKIKIPYIFLDYYSSLSAKLLYSKIINILSKNNISYIIEESDKMYLVTRNSKQLLKNLDEVQYISNILIVIEANYSKKAIKVVDTYLNKGLDILCFPSNILNSKAIFSNNLIRDGAICLTSEYMLLEYLTTFA